jgi:hypothetical protein
MRNLNILIYLFLVFTITIVSCAKETESEPTETINFKGTWDVTENSKDYGASTYTTTITDSLNGTYINFSNLYSFNKKVRALVSGKNFTIPSQTIQGNNFTGNGSLSNSSRIDMKYYVQSTTTHFDTVTAVLRK